MFSLIVARATDELMLTITCVSTGQNFGPVLCKKDGVRERLRTLMAQARVPFDQERQLLDELDFFLRADRNGGNGK